MKDRVRRGAVWLLAALSGCGGVTDSGVSLPNAATEPAAAGEHLVARFAQITDVHLLDEESPARFAPADVVVPTAWRPQEAYSTQVFDGLLRAVNRRQERGDRIDFVLFTGDLVDGAQQNELGWFLDCVEGRVVDPRSGPDDRDPAAVPAPETDPHHPFGAIGLYRHGFHGRQASIPWYAAVGNHDRYAIGNLPVSDLADGRRIAPLPLFQVRPGWWIPRWLEADGDSTYGRITPANSGPVPLFSLPERITANPDRRFLSADELAGAFLDTVTLPPGHGFGDTGDTPTWYSVSPAAGLRLVVLDTSFRPSPAAGELCSEGFLTSGQLDFLRGEIAQAEQRDELVVLVTHHPSPNLDESRVTEANGGELRAVLEASPNVVLHLAGHLHRHRVTQRGGYVEMETASVIDYPQEGRWIEIWRDEAAGTVTLRYDVFSHLPHDEPPTGNPLLDDDPLAGLRQRAWELAREDAGVSAAYRSVNADSPEAVSGDVNPLPVGLEGGVSDRVGSIGLR